MGWVDGLSSTCELIPWVLGFFLGLIFVEGWVGLKPKAIGSIGVFEVVGDFKIFGVAMGVSCLALLSPARLLSAFLESTSVLSPE